MRIHTGNAAILFALLGIFSGSPALGQHEGHAAPPASADRNLFQSDMAGMTGMTPSDAAPAPAEGWHLMDLGVARLSWNDQGGPSGGSAIESGNWNMVHASRSLGPGRLSLMMMNSLEPATYAAQGSRELFQTGESYKGQPLVDRQHPHDFFMNLSATWRLNVSSDAGVWLQLAPVGEPALGPVAFMHRASSGDNPTAPLGHHWTDSTHIAFNVVTLGAGWRWLAVDGSVFHGREPDENRWDIQGGPIDSASGRIRFFLGRGWSAEISHGFIKEPEAPLQPGNTHRTTASISWGAAGDRPYAVTVLWGRNDEQHGTSDAFLAEAAWQGTPHDQIYARAELVQKDTELLLTKSLSLSEEPNEPQGGAAHLSRIGAFTVGYVRDFDLVAALRTGVGLDVTGYTFPGSLAGAYGDFPVSLHVFLRIRWGISHGDHSGHAGMKM